MAISSFTVVLAAWTLAGALPSPKHNLAVVVASGSEVEEPSQSDVEALVSELSHRVLGLNVVTAETLFVRGSDPLKCGGDLECLSKDLTPAGVDLGLIVVPLELGGELRASIRLVDVGAKEMRSRVEGRIDQDLQGSLRALIEEALAVLALPPAAHVAITVDPPESSVTFQSKSGDELHLGAGSHKLPPGDYSVLVTSEGYEESRTDLVAEAGKTKSLQISLAPEESNWLESPWVWVGAGAVVVGVVVTAIVLSQSGGDVVCIGVPGADCPDPR